MSQIVGANFSIGQFFKSASMFTPTSSIVTISAISSGSITFTPALSNYTTIRSASLSWLDSSSLSPFYSITGGGSFQSIDSTAFSVLFSFGSTTTIVTQSNSSFIFNSSSIVGASTRQFSISYLTQSIQSYYDDTVEEAYVQLTIDTTNNENSIKFDTGLLNSTTGEVEFTSNTPVKGGIGTSARGIGSFAMGSGSIVRNSWEYLYARQVDIINSIPVESDRHDFVLALYQVCLTVPTKAGKITDHYMMNFFVYPYLEAALQYYGIGNNVNFIMDSDGEVKIVETRVTEWKFTDPDGNTTIFNDPIKFQEAQSVYSQMTFNPNTVENLPQRVRSKSKF